MEYVTRDLENVLTKRLFAGKVIVLFGPRQTGKTTLLGRLLDDQKQKGVKSIRMTGDNPDHRALVQDASPERLRTIMGNSRILLIDEAQQIPGIGMTVKRLFDAVPDIQILLSGSSSLDLAHQVGEPLTGRQFRYTLLPFSFTELANHSDILTERQHLESRLVFGSYPDIVTRPDDAAELLRNLVGGYLYKDILALQAVRDPPLLDKLVRALAFQSGSEVSFAEVGQLIGADGRTVERYIDLLAKCFVLFVLPAYANNLRNELKKTRKVYFYDCGVRNAVIGNFLPIQNRGDVGALWEAYLIGERLKWRLRNAPDTRAFFWRTTAQAEIDLVEESAAGLHAYEFKWGGAIAKKARCPLAFANAYPKATWTCVDRSNYDLFVTGKL